MVLSSAIGMLYQSTCVGLGYGPMEGYFQEPLNCTTNPIRWYNLCDPSLPPGPGILTCVPIDYAFRPRLRSRLTLLRLALSRKPLDFRRQGFSPCLSLLMSSFSLLIAPPVASRPGFTAENAHPVPKVRNLAFPITERSATVAYATRSFGSWLEPRYIFAAG